MLAGLTLPGCGDDDDDTNPVGPGSPSTQFSGIFIGGTSGGRMTLSIPLASGDLASVRPERRTHAQEVSALATLSFDAGATVILVGTYREETDSLQLTGGGYLLSGAYDPAEPIPGITGQFTGPGEPGLFDCAVDLGSAGVSDVQSWCGEQTQDQSVYERMHVGVLALTEVFGFIEIEGEPIHFEGILTASGSGIHTVHATRILGGGTVLTIDGTLDPTTKDMWGEWMILVNGLPDRSGEWNLGHCLPGTTGPN